MEFSNAIRRAALFQRFFCLRFIFVINIVSNVIDNIIRIRYFSTGVLLLIIPCRIDERRIEIYDGARRFSVWF